MWQTVKNKTRYEVRSAGNTRRLYTNGVLHTQYNPEKAVTGNIWDLLFLPALLRPDATIKRILILGVGGGAVVNLLNRYIQPNRVIGVDLSKIHLRIARDFFSVKGANIQLIRANAVDWVSRYRGQPFDYIVEDLFVDEEGEPVRAVEMDKTWAARLFRILNKEGVLVMNFESTAELKKSALFTCEAVNKSLHSLLVLKSPQNENSVAVLSRKPLHIPDLLQRIRKIPRLDAAYKSAQLRYSIRRKI
ncbi:MAG: class I SAM-dependent methyltransferase [Gammaproteobacteria bacterium]